MCFGALASDPDQRQWHIEMAPGRAMSAGKPRNFFVKVATTLAIGVDASKSATETDAMETETGKLLNHPLDSADCRYSRGICLKHKVRVDASHLHRLPISAQEKPSQLLVVDFTPQLGTAGPPSAPGA